MTDFFHVHRLKPNHLTRKRELGLARADSAGYSYTLFIALKYNFLISNKILWQKKCYKSIDKEEAKAR